MDKAYETPRWAQVIMWLVLILGLLAPAVMAEEFDLNTLKGKTVVKTGLCTLEGEGDADFLHGVYVCTILEDSDTVAYLVVQSTPSEDLVCVIKMTLVEGNIVPEIVWKRKIPCVGLCA